MLGWVWAVATVVSLLGATLTPSYVAATLVPLRVAMNLPEPAPANSVRTLIPGFSLPS